MSRSGKTSLLALCGLLTIAIFGESPAANGAELAGNSASAQAVTPQDLGFEEILFVKRKPYSSDHYYTDINNGTSPDRFLPENGP